MELEQIGEWAFIVGVIIAVLSGVVYKYLSGVEVWIPLVLVILGIIVGLLNIKDKETTPFLIASIALLATNGMEQFFNINDAIPGLGTVIFRIFDYISVFVAPAAIIVAVVTINKLAMKK